MYRYKLDIYVIDDNQNYPMLQREIYKENMLGNYPKQTEPTRRSQPKLGVPN